MITLTLMLVIMSMCQSTQVTKTTPDFVLMSQDHQGRRVYQVSQVDLDPQDSQDHLVSLEPKVNQAQLELDHPDQPESRYRTQPYISEKL